MHLPARRARLVRLAVERGDVERIEFDDHGAFQPGIALRHGGDATHEGTALVFLNGLRYIF